MEAFKAISLDFALENLKTPPEIHKLSDESEAENVIVVNNCPSQSEAAKLLADQNFTEKLKKLKNIKAIVLSVNSPLDVSAIEPPKLHDLDDASQFLVTFEQQTVADGFRSVAFWRAQKGKNFLRLDNDREFSSGVFAFVRNFLVESAIAGHSGFSKTSNPAERNDSRIKISTLATSAGLNMLMLAVDRRQPRALLEEILRLPFDINQESHDKMTASDIVWHHRSFDALLLLLNANATFPKAYDDDVAPAEVRAFASMCRRLHDAIRAEKTFDAAKAEIEEVVRAAPHLRHFYNSRNKSAAALALEEHKLDLYQLLLDHIVIVGRNESFESIRSLVTDDMCQSLRHVHAKHSRQLPQKHLMVFMSNSSVGHDDLHSNERHVLVKDALELLDSIELCSKVLQVVAAHRNFKIYYDFYRKSVEFMDPANDKSTYGIFYFSGQIFIGAKELLNPLKKLVAIGTIIHEVCHFALVLVFRNFGCPYAVDDEAAEAEFQRVFEACEKVRDREEIVDWVYGYEGSHHAELIVRVVHMLAHYHGNEEKLRELREVYEPLFRYFEEKVVPAIEASIPVIEQLNAEHEMTFGDLTEPLRRKVFSTDVNFQGQEVKLSEIIDCSPSSAIYAMEISSVFKETRSMFSNCEDIAIGKEEVLDIDFYVERFFLKRKLDNRDQWEVRTLDEIAAEVRSERIFLLSDHAGAGKTTTFKHLSTKLKEQFKTCWISFVDLKKHLDVYGRHERSLQDADDAWTSEKIVELLTEILAVRGGLDEVVFRHLFDGDRVILLFDGVDEISPTFKDFIKCFIQKVQALTSNQLWIATRPQFADELEDFFGINARKLKPSDAAEKAHFIRRILASEGTDGAAEQDVKIQKVEAFMEKLSNGSEDYAINNPLMLELITRLCSSQPHTEANFYAIYQQMLAGKIETTEARGEVVGRDIRAARSVERAHFSIWQIFQCYALRTIFGGSFKDVMSDFVETIDFGQLSLFQRWKSERSKWSPEAISRYGVLIVDNWDSEDECGDFIHRTFAEFFVARYLIDNIYEESGGSVSESEKMLRLKLLISIGATRETEITRLDVIRRFLTSYPEMRQDGEQRIFDATIKDFLVTKYRTSFLFYSKETSSYDAVTATLFLSRFFIQDGEIVNALWLGRTGGGGGGSFFRKIFSSASNNLHDIMRYVETVEKLYGLEWPEKTKFIRKRGAKFFLVERPVAVPGDEVSARFFRLLDVIMERLPRGQRRAFFRKYIYDILESFCANVAATSEIFRRVRTVFGGRKQLAGLMRGFIERSHPASCIFRAEFAEFFWRNSHIGFDRKVVRSLLLFEYVPTSQPLLNAFASNDERVRGFYRSLYRQHLSGDEIERLFVAPQQYCVDNLFWRVSRMDAGSCSSFCEFLLELRAEGDGERLRRFFVQRNGRRLTVLGCLSEQRSLAFSSEGRDAFCERFEIFRRCALQLFSEREVLELCEKPSGDVTYVNYVWTKVINRREV